MTRKDAHAVLHEHLAFYRARTYNELKRLLKDKDETKTRSPEGEPFAIRVYATWADGYHVNLRIWGEMRHNFWTAIKPVTESFVVGPPEFGHRPGTSLAVR